MPISSYPPHFPSPPQQPPFYTTLSKEQQKTMATTKSKSLTIHSGKPATTTTQLPSPLPCRTPETTPRSIHSWPLLHGEQGVQTGRRGSSKAPQLIELNISFQIFTFFTSFLGAFQYFTFFFNSLSTLAPPSPSPSPVALALALATHKLNSLRTQRLAAPFEFEWK